MRNAPEVVREVGVHDVRMTTEQQLLHLYSGLLGVAPSAVGVDFWWKIGFEDRFQHQQSCCHADPIPHDRDAQRSEFAVGLRYKHSSDWFGPVGLLPAAHALDPANHSPEIDVGKTDEKVPSEEERIARTEPYRFFDMGASFACPPGEKLHQPEISMRYGEIAV